MAAKTDKTRFATDPYGIIERGVPGGDAESSFSIGRVGSPVESVVEPGRSFGSGIGGRLTIPIKEESPEIKKKAKGGKVQTSADTARKLATEMGGMKKGGKPKSGLAVMIAIGETKKPVKKAVGGVGKMRKGMMPEKLAKGGAGKVRKGMMTPEGKIIDVMNKIRGK